MRIAVAGIGGVGGYIGAKLCATGHEVVFIARGEHARTVREKGITVIEDVQRFTARPHAVVQAEEYEGVIDLLLVCVKGYAIDTLLDALHPAIGEATIIVPFANGVEHAEAIAKRVDARVLNGCVYILSHIEEAGVIRKEGKVFAAVFGGEVQAAQSVQTVFEAAGLRCKVPGNIEEAVWKKYLFISAFAALTTYYDMSIKGVYDAYPAEAEVLLEEIASVARSKGIEIGDEVPKALQTAASLPESASTSMHLDFTMQRQSELETLCGYVVRQAGERGVKVAWMEKIYTALKGRE